MYIILLKNILDSNSVTEFECPDGSLVILDVFDDVVLACERNCLKPDKLVIGKFPGPGEEQNIIWNDLTESDVVPGLEHCTYKYLDLKASGDCGELDTIFLSITEILFQFGKLLCFLR